MVFQRGYSALSGLPTTGNVWYINGYMTPELFLQRGRSYTFTVEGGNRPSDPGTYSHLDHNISTTIAFEPVVCCWRIQVDFNPPFSHFEMFKTGYCQGFQNLSFRIWPYFPNISYNQILQTLHHPGTEGHISIRVTFPLIIDSKILLCLSWILNFDRLNLALLCCLVVTSTLKTLKLGIWSGW